jgi:hypothetical protein
MTVTAPQVQSVEAAVERHLRRWGSYVDDRLMAHHPTRSTWDRGRFLVELGADAPELTAEQLVAVVEAFGGFVSRATVPPYAGKPALVLPGRVSQLVADLDVLSVLDVP